MTPSLKDALNYVPNARIETAPPFEPEAVVLEDYNFVPFVRNGLSGAIAGDPEAGKLRASISVNFDVKGDGSPTKPVGRTITLYGPGDVVGVNPAQVIRRVPAPGTGQAEETYLAQIEFNRPDLPWLFSPQGAVGDRLEPWLALVVCERGKSKLLPPVSPGLPRVLVTELGELQSLDDNAFFAHAQVIDGAKVAIPRNPAIAARLSDEHALANLSRLICPRKLEADQRYRAILVPAFDCGVKAGLGLPGGTLARAWTRAADGSDALSPVQLPAYDSWDFETAPSGDFKSLAERLQPIKAPWRIGRRMIDAAQPGARIADLGPEESGRVQVLVCALKSPSAPPVGTPTEADAGWTAGKRDELREKVDEANLDDPELPRVGPRLYARFQAARNSVGAVFGSPPAASPAADDHWFSQLNTTPTHRIVAGLGTRVVQKDQEPLMQAAWAQVGELTKVNHQIQQHQLARALNESQMKRRIAPLDLPDQVRLTRPVHMRVRLPSRSDSLWNQVEVSRTAGSYLSLAARRMIGPTAPAMRKGIRLRELDAVPDIVAPNDRFLDQRLAYRNPDGIDHVSDQGLDLLGPALVGKVLGVPPQSAFATLRNRLGVLSEGTAISRLSGGVGEWTIDAGQRVGSLYAKLLGSRVDSRSPNSREGAQVLRAELAGEALAAFANVADPGFSRGVEGKLKALGQSLPKAVVRRDIGSVVGERPIVERPLSPFRGGGLNIPRTTGLGVPGALGNLNDVGVRGPRVVAGQPVLENREPPPDLPPIARFETSTSRELAREISAVANLKVLDVAKYFEASINGIALPLPDTRPAPLLDVTSDALIATLAPAKTMTAYVKGRVQAWPSPFRAGWFDDLRVEPIMAAPVFERPMYEALDAYDREWLVPGLGEIKQTDFVTLLEANPAFCETFLVGLSDEMGRELLWRNYATDQRGTYFKRFWDADEDELTQPIHGFSPSSLGSHIAIGGGGGSTAAPAFLPVVLVVRGALVRRYPEAIVVAVEATGTSFPPTFDPNKEAPILFHAHLKPDYLLVGFKLSAEQVRAGKWWFLLAEHPTAPRFGMAAAGPTNPRALDPRIDQKDLDWNDLTGFVGGSPSLDRGGFLAPSARTVTIGDSGSKPEDQVWPGSSAVVARTLLRDPVRAAFEGRSLIDSIRPGGGGDA